MPIRDSVDVAVEILEGSVFLGLAKILGALSPPVQGGGAEGTVTLTDPSPVSHGVEEILTVTPTGAVTSVTIHAAYDGGAEVLLGTLTNPWTQAWTAANVGPYALIARGYAGAELLDADTVAVTALPVGSIVLTALGDRYAGVEGTGTATPSGDYDSVRVYVAGELVDTLTEAPWTYELTPAAAGELTVEVRTYYDGAQVATDSETITVGSTAAAIATTGNWYAALLPNQGLDTTAGTWTDVIRGLVFNADTGERGSVNATGWRGEKPTLTCNGTVGYRCTDADLNAIASGVNPTFGVWACVAGVTPTPDVVLVGFERASAYGVVRQLAQAHSTPYATKWVNGSTGPTATGYRTTIPTHVGGYTISSSGSVSWDGMVHTTASTSYGTGYTIAYVDVYADCNAPGSAARLGLVGEGGPVFFTADPASVDQDAFELLLQDLGYGTMLDSTREGDIYLWGDSQDQTRLTREMALACRPRTGKTPARIVTIGDFVGTGAASDYTTLNALLAKTADTTAGTHPTRPRFSGCIGNHETVDGSWAANMAAGVPGLVACYETGLHYGTEVVGDVRMIYLDSSDITTGLDAQRVWLAATLAASTAAWNVVLCHSPLLMLSTWETWPAAIDDFVYICEQSANRVHLFLSGHLHTTGVTESVTAGAVAAHGIIHAHLGSVDAALATGMGVDADRTYTVNSAARLRGASYTWDAAVAGAYSDSRTSTFARIRANATALTFSVHALASHVETELYTVTRTDPAE